MADQILKFYENAPWVTFIENCEQNCDPPRNMALMAEGLCGHEEIIKNSSSLKPPIRF